MNSDENDSHEIVLVKKTIEEYSRNVRRLKVKLAQIQEQKNQLQKKIYSLESTSNDKITALKLARFCKERKMTPQMIFRFADRKTKGSISKADWNATLNRIGFKLSREQTIRMEYMIDEDLSGEITWIQFDAYLRAFGIKKQFDTHQPLNNQLSNVLQLIDGINHTSTQKNLNLLSYEDFVRYCNRNFAQMRNKQIVSIFQRLQRNNKISIQDFLNYLNNLKQQKERLRQKNEKKKVKDIGTLKQILIALLSSRRGKGHLQFTSSQFMRLQRSMNRKKGDIMTLFRDLDYNKRGVIGFNELITKIAVKQPISALFGFEMMGRKISLQGHSVEQIILQYSNYQKRIQRGNLIRLLQVQFQLKEPALDVYMKLVLFQQNYISHQKLIELMQLKQLGVRRNFIYPNIKRDKKQKSQFGYMLISYSASEVLDICLNIAEQLNTKKQKVWNDPEYGSTEVDENGNDSLDLSLPYESILWLRTLQIGMIQLASDKKYAGEVISSNVCPHELLARTFESVNKVDENALFHKQKINYTIKTIEQQNLSCLLNGIYPLMFQRFLKLGIAVFKYLFKGKFVYVIFDDSIPCSQEKIPLFQRDSSYAWLSLFQKGYSKLLGTYRQFFQLAFTSSYSFGFSKLIKIENNFVTFTKEQIWRFLISSDKRHIFASNKKQFTGTVILNGIQTGINYCQQIKINALQQKISSQQNEQRIENSTYRLLFLHTKVLNEVQWNPSWNSRNQKNKYNSIESIRTKTKEIQDYCVVLDFDLFLSLFDCFIEYRSINPAKAILLKKNLEFQDKFTCRYQIQAKQSISVIFTLSRTPKQIYPPLKFKIVQNNLASKQFLIIKGFWNRQLLINKNQKIFVDICVKDWKDDSESSTLQIYFQHENFNLKEKDRHLPFKRIDYEDEKHDLLFKNYSQAGQQQIRRQFYKGAQRKGGCCGCL